MNPLILGCDPGGRFCGLALLHDRDLVAWDLVEREEGQSLAGWIGECYSGALLLALKAIETYGFLVSGRLQITVAVEDVNPPKLYIDGKRQMISPESLIGTAAVMGALVAWAATEGFPCLLVPPGKNGTGPREGYPAELWGSREGPAGTGRLGHVRSAWDIALAGRTKLKAVML